MSLSPTLGLLLQIGMEDGILNDGLGIPKVKGLYANGID